MADSPKLKRLKEMQAKLAAGKFTDKELKESRVADTDGRMVRLADDDAAEVIARRIEAENPPVIDTPAEVAEEPIDAPAQDEIVTEEPAAVDVVAPDPGDELAV